jgi:hypothetical protein
MRPLVLAFLFVSLNAHAADPSFIQRGEFAGKKILFINYDDIEPNEKYVPGILRDLGFTVDVKVAPKALPPLDGYDQLWMVSSCASAYNFGDAEAERVVRFVKKGKGFYNVMDNVPCVIQGTLAGQKLHGISMSGNYIGQQVINVVSPGAVKKMFEEAMKKGDMNKLTELRRAGFLNGKLYAEDHELLNGISKLYEGITLCHMTESPDLDVILRASDNQSLVAVSKKEGEKVIHDCGFTRMFYQWEANAQTSTHWYQNVATYLMGKQRKDLKSQ